MASNHNLLCPHAWGSVLQDCICSPPPVPAEGEALEEGRCQVPHKHIARGCAYCTVDALASGERAADAEIGRLRSQLAERDEEIGKLRGGASRGRELVRAGWSDLPKDVRTLIYELEANADPSCHVRDALAAKQNQEAIAVVNESLRAANASLEERLGIEKAAALKLAEDLLEEEAKVASLEERLRETLEGKTRLEGCFHEIGKYVEEHHLHRYVTVRYGGETDVLQIIRGLHEKLTAAEALSVQRRDQIHRQRKRLNIEIEARAKWKSRAEKAEAERDEAREEERKYRTAASVLCGTHIGRVADCPTCPVCRAAALAWAARGGNAIRDTADLLTFVADRLVATHGEDEAVDYVRACYERARMLRNALSPGTPSANPGEISQSAPKGTEGEG